MAQDDMWLDDRTGAYLHSPVAPHRRVDQTHRPLSRPWE
jgi:hypothetical protein